MRQALAEPDLPEDARRRGELEPRGAALVLSSSAPLAKEYQSSDISRVFKANGTVRPDTAIYQHFLENQFGIGG